MKKLKAERPLLLVGSPMCAAFSRWQRINNLIRDPVTVQAEKKRAIVHLEFCMELYREQIRHGRYFVHEHPVYATSWQEPSVEKLMGEIGVEKAICDQCLHLSGIYWKIFNRYRAFRRACNMRCMLYVICCWMCILG